MQFRAVAGSLRLSLIIYTLILGSIGPNQLSAQERDQDMPRLMANSEALRLFENPLIDAIRHMPELPADGLSELVDENLSDANPFFLKGQSWSIPSSTGPVDSFVKTGSSVELVASVGGMNRVLRISAPLTPILATPDYILLSADHESYFSAGEFLFLIERQQLAIAGLQNAPVPVYSIPMIDKGWTGNLQAWHLPAIQSSAVQNADGFLLPLEEADLQKIVQIEKMNLLFASLESDGLNLRPHSTAGYGMVFIPQPDFLVKKFNIEALRTKLTQQETKFDILKYIGISSAFAQPMDPELANQLSAAISNVKLLERLVRVTVILGTGFAVGSLLKHFKYREEFEKRRLQDGFDAKRENIINREWRNLRDTLDVYAAVLTSLSQVSVLSTAEAVDYVFDRFAPSISAGKNQFVRKILDKTVGYTKRSAEKVPVNWKTLVLGSFVFGLSDTAQVAAQLYYVNGEIATLIANAFPSMKDRVEAGFDPHNPNFQTYNRNELIRNLAAYLTSGASSYSSETKSQLEQKLSSEVEAEMAKEGFRPDQQGYQEELKNRKESVIRQALKDKGLPGADQFLFDFSSVIAGFEDAMGMKVESEGLSGNDRPGLVISALDRAISEIKSRLEGGSNLALEEGLAVLKRAKNRISYARSLLGVAPWKLASKAHWASATQAVREARQSLVALTYQGEYSADIAKLPTAWVKEFGTEGAFVAATFYRQAFFSMFLGTKEILEGMGSEGMRFENEARAYAVAGIKSRYEGARNLDEHALLRSKWRSELALIESVKRTELALEKKQKEEPYQEPEEGIFSKIHKNRIYGSSQNDFYAAHKKMYEPAIATEAERAEFYGYFRKNYIEGVGLRPDYEKNPELEQKVLQQSENLVSEILKQEKVMTFLNGLTPDEREQKISVLKASSEVAAYIATTVESSKMHGTDPAQPGVFQKIRQSDLLRGEGLLARFATRTIRFAESLGSDNSYTPGLKSWVYRNVPTVYDLWTGMDRSFRGMALSMTTGFLYFKVLWGVDMHYSTWLMLGLVGFTIRGPMQWLNRAFKNESWQPMGSVPLAFIYSIPYSWVTFTGSIPIALYMEDFMKPNVWPWFMSAAAIPVLPIVWEKIRPIRKILGAPLRALTKLRTPKTPCAASLTTLSTGTNLGDKFMNQF